VRQVVWPAKDAGRDIVCDRFIDSTVAYQGIARGLELEKVEDLNALVVGSCVPDLTVLLRIDPDEAERRGQQRLVAGVPDGTDRFEGAGIDFQRAVAAAYDQLAARHPERIVVVDAAGEIGDVHTRVMDAVHARAS
jgi:dTMP kinase